MDPLASLTSLAVLALVAVTVGYAFACAVAPWGRCLRCHGVGRRTTRQGTLTRAWCRRCNGTGRRVRVGRRLWTWIRHEFGEGN